MNAITSEIRGKSALMRQETASCFPENNNYKVNIFKLCRHLRTSSFGNFPTNHTVTMEEAKNRLGPHALHCNYHWHNLLTNMQHNHIATNKPLH